MTECVSSSDTHLINERSVVLVIMPMSHLPETRAGIASFRRELQQNLR